MDREQGGRGFSVAIYVTRLLSRIASLRRSRKFDIIHSLREGNGPAGLDRRYVVGFRLASTSAMIRVATASMIVLFCVL